MIIDQEWFLENPEWLQAASVSLVHKKWSLHSLQSMCYVERESLALSIELKFYPAITY